MTLGLPLGLLALLAAPAIVAAYFLRRKQPPRRVSALFLWRTPDQRAEAGPRLERFSREASLALELLAVVACALFLADARCGAQAPRRHLVVVVDGSLSMNATVNGATAAERAKKAVSELIAAEGASVITIVETGVRPRVLAGPQLERERALSLLEAWSPAGPSHDVVSGLLLARELCSERDQRVHFFTDGPLPEAVQAAVPPQVEVRSVGVAANNLAFLSAQRRDENGVASVTVRVGNFSDAVRTADVRFAPVNGAVQTQSVTLAPSGSTVLRVGFKTEGAIEVTLPHDALPEDGALTLLPAPLAEVHVALQEGLDSSARSALLKVFAIAPGVSVAPPSTVAFGPPGSGARVTIGVKGGERSFIGPFFSQKGDDLLDDVQLGGVVWTAGENPSGRVLMSMGDAALLTEDDDGALHLNLDVGRSNAQRTAAWPVLVSNVLRRLRDSAPGLPRRHVMLGEDVPVVTSAGATWLLKSDDGTERPVLGVGPLAVPPLPKPGRWQLLRDGKAVDALEVLPLDPRESDLRTRGPYVVEAKRKEAFASLALAPDRAMWPVVVVLLFLLLDFWLTARRQPR